MQFDLVPTAEDPLRVKKGPLLPLADVAVATTGYAEPSATDGVTVPFAWWAVAQRGRSGKFSVRHGRVECPGASRIDAQRIVADAALAELVSFLRELRG